MSSPDSPPGSEEPASPEGEPEVDPLIGRVIADRYRVDEQLGVGGMGAVYRAEHVLMKKSVAVKVLHREMTVLTEVVKRFEREAIAAGRIDHPNVAVATDFGKLDDGSFYLVLEYVAGRSLTRALEEDGAFSVERALFVARQVAAGLGAAHAAGIVHRDLKPDNIMLIERGGTKDFVKVLDFGIAKVAAEGESNQLTRLGSVFGTPAYMAPEQAAGQPVDGRADLYALGLVLYEMLAGHATFRAHEMVALLTKQLTERPPPLPDSIPADVVSLVMTLLEKDPKDRVQSSGELVAIIEARLGPLALPPDSTTLGVPSIRGLGTPVAAATAPAISGVEPALPQRGGAAAPSRPRFSLHALASRVLAGETIPIGGRDVPSWLVAAALGALIVGVVLTLGLLGRSEGTPGLASSAPPPPPAPELGEVLRRSTEGDREALSVLAARNPGRRTAAEWRAIGLGNGKLGEHVHAVAALKEGVRIDPRLAEDLEVLAATRRAIDDNAARSQALALAENGLGPGGIDVIFDVWASTSDKTEKTALAKSILDRESSRKRASPPLRVALELRRTTRCDDLKALVTEAKEVADERAFRRLTQLSARKGCGFLGLADCYPCLRKDAPLTEALEAAQKRQGPRF